MKRRTALASLIAAAVLTAFGTAAPSHAAKLGNAQEIPYFLMKVDHPYRNPSAFHWAIALPRCFPPCPPMPSIDGYRVLFTSTSPGNPWRHELFVNADTRSINANTVPFPRNGEYEWQVWVVVRFPGGAAAAMPAIDPPKKFQISRAFAPAPPFPETWPGAPSR